MEETAEQAWQEVMKDMTAMTRSLKLKKTLTQQEKEYLQRLLALHMQEDFPSELKVQADTFQALIEQRLGLPQH